MDITLDILFTLLRWSVVVLPCIYLLNRYTKFLYGFTLLNYFSWLFKPKARQPIDLGVPVFTFILFIASAFFTSFITDSVYMKVFAKQQEYVYLGNSTEFNARYYKEGDNSAKVITVLSPDITYNYSFDNIERKQSFFQESIMTTDLGNTPSQYSFARAIMYFFISSMFIIPMLGTLHACFRPMCSQQFTYDDPKNIYNFEWNVSFDKVLQQRGLSLGLWATLWLLSLILMIFSSNYTTRQEFGERVSSLPYMISPQNILEAAPISIKVIYKTIRDDKKTGSNFAKEYKTTRRNVTFSFDDLFSHTVFVTTIVDVVDNAELETLIQNNINHNKKMSIIIDEDFSFDLVTDKRLL